MTKIRKTGSDAVHLGKRLRDRRLDLNLTLAHVAKSIGVDVGQLSRFERGEFVFITSNLQNLISFLQIKVDVASSEKQRLVGRFEALVLRSSRHEEAARALVSALEALR